MSRAEPAATRHIAAFLGTTYSFGRRRALTTDRRCPQAHAEVEATADQFHSALQITGAIRTTAA